MLVKQKTLKNSALGEQNVMGQIISSCLFFVLNYVFPFSPLLWGLVK
jgi:hypothetical protein